MARIKSATYSTFPSNDLFSLYPVAIIRSIVVIQYVNTLMTQLIHFK